jgi:hypothetical protein
MIPAADPAAATRRTRLPTALWRHCPAIVTAALIAVWLLLALRSLQFFCYEDDEGTFLLTALSMLQGHSLYTDIWHNYLPGLVALVVASFRVGGASVEAPRVLMVLFGALTMAGVAAVAGASGRRWAAPLAAALLLATPNHARMGRSVMGETPASALCIAAALAVLCFHGRRRLWWLALAGVVIGLSALVKYPTAIMLPIIGIDLLALAIAERWPLRTLLGAVALLGLASAVPIVLAMALVDLPAAWDQVVATYLHAARFYGLRLGRNTEIIRGYLQQNNVGLVPLALLGLGLLFAARRPGAWMLAAWLGLTLVGSLVSSPLSSHHLYLLLAPLVVAAAVGLASLPASFARLRRPLRPELVALSLLGALSVALLIAHAPKVVALTRNRLTPSPNDHAPDRQVVALLAAHIQEGDQLVCDYPMIVFRAGCSSPPWLVNTSGLRFRNSDLDAQVAIAVSQADPPAAVIFWENKFLNGAPEYITWVQQEYVEIQRDEVIEKRAEPPKFRAVYLRPDRAETSAPLLSMEAVSHGND